MKNNAIRHLVLPMLCMLFASAAQAQGSASKEALYVRTMAASCANCHGTDGKAVAGSPLTALAGLDKTYFIAQMAAFKSGARPATVMHQLSKGFNDAQIETLATYFAAQKN